MAPLGNGQETVLLVLGMVLGYFHFISARNDPVAADDILSGM
jgi:hypothetical protein